MDFWLEPWLETVSQVCSAINLKINNCIVISHAVVPGAACINGVKVLDSYKVSFFEWVCSECLCTLCFS